MWVTVIAQNTRMQGPASYTEDRQGDVQSTTTQKPSTTSLMIYAKYKDIPWSYVLCIYRMPGLSVVERKAEVLFWDLGSDLIPIGRLRKCVHFSTVVEPCPYFELSMVHGLDIMRQSLTLD